MERSPSAGASGIAERLWGVYRVMVVRKGVTLRCTTLSGGQGMIRGISGSRERAPPQGAMLWRARRHGQGGAEGGCLCVCLCVVRTAPGVPVSRMQGGAAVGDNVWRAAPAT